MLVRMSQLLAKQPETRSDAERDLIRCHMGRGVRGSTRYRTLKRRYVIRNPNTGMPIQVGRKQWASVSEVQVPVYEEIWGYDPRTGHSLN